MFYFDFADHHVIGASPEILVRLSGDTVTLRPIAGTRPRGANPQEDAAIAEELLADPKERAEHVMLIDLGRNDVGRVAATGSVKVTERMVIERYSHVMHIVSNVEGRLAPGLSALDVLRASFPAGTVTGAPKVRAMQIIDELESVKRGVYSGAVGYLSFNGDMDVAIAIRTAVVKDKKLHVQAAGGRSRRLGPTRRMARDPPQGARAPSRGRAGRHLKIGVRARLLLAAPRTGTARERVRKLFLEPVPVRAAVLLKSRAVACKRWLSASSKP